ncbi:hypothetical protein [Runella sp.]|uniref:hypothetical protein n=1 Tax=Runella sp. TaxID=1960881 RepID=UPI003D0D923F
MKYLLTLFGALFITLSLQAQKLHVLFVVENEDPEFGLLQLRSEADMLQILEIAAWGLGYKMEVMHLSKQKFTATDLQQAIDSLPTGAKDIVVMYYAGYGLPPTNNKGFFANWKLRDNPAKGLSVDEVAGWLETKQKAQKLHLGLILSEYSAQSIHSSQRVPDTPGTSMAYRQQVVQKLFSGHCGIVKMGSSLPYEPSWVNKNHSAPLFTESLVRAFERMLMPSDSSALKQVSFRQLHAYSSNYLNRYFNDLPISQTPVLEIKSCQDSTYSTIIEARPDSLAAPIKVVGGLLNSLAQNKDTLQRYQIKKQLAAYFTPNATVRVVRLYGMNRIPKPKEYNLKMYLDTICLPSKNPGTQEVIPNMMYLYIGKIETDNPHSKRPLIRQLSVSETWGNVSH